MDRMYNYILHWIYMFAYTEDNGWQLDNCKVFELEASSLQVVLEVQDITMTRYTTKSHSWNIYTHTLKQRKEKEKKKQRWWGEKSVTIMCSCKIKIK